LRFECAAEGVEAQGFSGWKAAENPVVLRPNAAVGTQRETRLGCQSSATGAAQIVARLICQMTARQHAGR
jgi:hypothetical protein